MYIIILNGFIIGASLIWSWYPCFRQIGRDNFYVQPNKNYDIIAKYVRSTLCR